MFETVDYGLLTDLYIRSRCSRTVFNCQYPVINCLDSIKEENREIVYCVDKRGALFIPEEQTKQDITEENRKIVYCVDKRGALFIPEEQEQELKVRNYQKDIK